MLRDRVEKVLPRVEKPPRYTGHEWNSIQKDWETTSVRMVFAYPDTYEIGMSHLGLQILYGLINEREGFLLERTFAPWTDMEALMRSHQIPLFSLESCRPVIDFDVLGFTLQYELNYTNILNMLDLAGIPLRSADRKDDTPIVIAGGPCAFNPEPLTAFVDLFLIGDSEDSLPELLGLVKKHKEENAGKIKRRVFLQKALAVEGVYVPAFYDFSYLGSGMVDGKKVEAPAPAVVRKRAVKSLGTSYFPTKPIVPNMETVHDRMMLEIARGCTRGCRFCQAGILYRPVRERDVKLLTNQAKELAAATGHDEISLVSLSAVDYSSIEKLAKTLASELSERGISISLPSLRVDKFSVDLAHEVQKVRRATLTFAPEAGTRHLRDVINKGVTESDLIDAVSAAFAAGWKRVKLYFMIGLPTEKEADLEGIVSMTRKVLDAGRVLGKRAEVSVSVSSFIPKPHTPFQWTGQDRMETLREKQYFLKEKLRSRGITLHWHDARQSFIEAVISRGNRNLGKVLENAWSRGCKFDSWTEHFNFEAWQGALRDPDVGPMVDIHSVLETDAVLPWDHIETGVTKEFLVSELERAEKGLPTPDCRVDACARCGVCSGVKVFADVKGGGESEREV